MPRQKSLNDRYTELKDELEKLKIHTSELMVTSKKLEQEKMNLEGAVEGAAMLEKLSNELEQLNEDIAVKQKRKLECRNSSEQFKRYEEEINAVHEMVQNIAQENRKIKEIHEKMRGFTASQDTLKIERE